MNTSFNNKGFTRTTNFTKFGLLNFLRKQKNIKNSENFEYKNLVGGFTLVETLVAIAIFATSIVGLISITARGVNDNVFVKNKLTASYLAQEGVELVRNMRDTSLLPSSLEDPATWNEFLTTTLWIGNCYRPTAGSTNSCYIDGSLNSIEAFQCIDSTCPELGLDSETGLYTYNTTDSSNFTRTIYAQPASNENSDEILVVSEVSWDQGENTHKVRYQANLLNWFNP